MWRTDVGPLAHLCTIAVCIGHRRQRTVAHIHARAHIQGLESNLHSGEGNPGPTRRQFIAVM